MQMMGDTGMGDLASSFPQLKKYVEDTPGAENFVVPSRTSVLSDRVVVTGIPNSTEQVAGIIGAFNVGLVVTMTSLPLVIPGEPDSTKYGTSFPSGSAEVVAREREGIPFYETCMRAMSAGVHFLHLPTKDMDPLPLAYMPILQKSADEALAAGKGVWLQCLHGHFRSWSAALFVLQRCGPEPRPLDPMPFLRRLATESRAPSWFGDPAYICEQFCSRGPFANERRPICRPDADAKDVLWLLSTHPEARAFLLAAAMAAGEDGCCGGPGGGAQPSCWQKVRVRVLDSLLSFDDCDDVDFVMAGEGLCADQAYPARGSSTLCPRRRSSSNMARRKGVSGNVSVSVRSMMGVLFM